jgi:hypothetical protein
LETAVIGIYRRFGRSSRVAARILRTMLSPATCHTLTAVSGDPDGGMHPERIDVVVDVSRLPHPGARELAAHANAPLIARPVPTMQPETGGRTELSAIDRGTAAGRALALNRSTTRSARVTSVVARNSAPAARGR